MASLEERVAAIEEKPGLEAQARASMDDDLTSINAKLTAQGHLLQALAVTQGEHTRQLTKLDTRLTAVGATLDGHTASLQQIITMLGRLIERDGDTNSDDSAD